jgi:hypothetical protein
VHQRTQEGGRGKSEEEGQRMDAHFKMFTSTESWAGGIERSRTSAVLGRIPRTLKQTTEPLRWQMTTVRGRGGAASTAGRMKTITVRSRHWRMRSRFWTGLTTPHVVVHEAGIGYGGALQSPKHLRCYLGQGVGEPPPAVSRRDGNVEYSNRCTVS